MEMELKLTTKDIQHLIIAVISENTLGVFPRSDQERLLDTLNGLNTLCTKENDYTLTLKIES